MLMSTSITVPKDSRMLRRVSILSTVDVKDALLLGYASSNAVSLVMLVLSKLFSRSFGILDELLLSV